MLPKAAPCPICKRPVPAHDQEAPRPFCSPRCRTIDLGSWLTGAYRLSREIEEDDLDELPAGLSEATAEHETGKTPATDKRRRH